MQMKVLCIERLAKQSSAELYAETRTSMRAESMWSRKRQSSHLRLTLASNAAARVLLLSRRTANEGVARCRSDFNGRRLAAGGLMQDK